jgi:hypothetical protein
VEFVTNAPRGSSFILAVAFVFQLPALLAASSSRIQAPVAGAPSELRVLKISAGPSGADKNGTFTLTEERSTFSRTTDREVIVFFQWEGSPGAHKLVANWRSPDGAVSANSTMDYVAKERRFGAYWPLYLSSSTALGTWSVEATVDGQPAGRYSFEIRDERVEPAVVRPTLTPTQLYEQLGKAFAVIERTGAAGRKQSAAGGFVLQGGRVFTAASTLDGVEALQIVAPDGSRYPVKSIHAWNRAAGWAILTLPGVPGGPLQIAAAGATKIGDRLFTIEGTESGVRVLREGQMSGELNTPGAGRRLLVSFPEGGGMMGSPVVDEFGAIVGFVAGPTVAGATSPIDLLRLQASMRGHSVVPLSLVRAPLTPVETTLAELQASGAVALPLSGDEHVVSGGFARGILRSPAPRPSGQSDDFSLTDKMFVTFVNWTPVERLRGETQLVVYDETNNRVVQSPAKKSDFRKGQFVMAYWELPVPGTPGLYRAEVLFNGRPAWRGFVRINP